jgi:predicted PurR-regulated permease PerM
MNENNHSGQDIDTAGRSRETDSCPEAGQPGYPYRPKKNIALDYAHYFLLFLIIIFLWASYNVIQGYIHSIILAIILATVFYPIHRRIYEKLNHRKNLAAAISCLLIILVVIIPLTIIIFSLIRQGINSFHAISEWVEAGKLQAVLGSDTVTKVVSVIDKYMPELQLKDQPLTEFDLSRLKLDQIIIDFSSSIGKTLINQGGSIVGNITTIIGKFFIMIFTFFFFIRDQEAISQTVLHLSPLSSSDEQKIILKIKSVARSAILGTLITAMAQGIAGGIAFAIVGIPALFFVDTHCRNRSYMGARGRLPVYFGTDPFRNISGCMVDGGRRDDR